MNIRWSTFYIGFHAIILLLIAIGSSYILLGENIFNWHPGWSDELHYWQEAKSFRATGFNGGYFVINEKSAPADFSNYGPHGPLFPALQALMVTANSNNFPIYFNISLLALGLTAVRIFRPAIYFVVLLFVVSCPPIILYLVSGMQAVLHISISLLVFSLCRYWKSVSALFLFAGFFRITWIVGSPIAYLVARDKKKFNLLVFLACIIGAVLVVLVTGQLSAPLASNGIGAEWRHAFSESFFEGTQVVIRNFYENMLLWFEGLSIVSSLPEQRFRAFFSLAIVANLLFLPYMLKDKNSESQATNLILLNAIAVLLLTLLFYQVGYWRDLRVLLPYFVLLVANIASILGVLFRPIVPILVVLGINSFLAPPFIEAFKSYRSVNFEAPSSSKLLAYALEKIEYNPEQSPWCNTLVVSPEFYKYSVFLHIEPGLGISTNYHAVRNKKAGYYLFGFSNNNEDGLILLKENKEFSLKYNPACQQ